MDVTANPRVPNLTTSAQLSLATAVAMLLCNAAGGHATELQPDIRADRLSGGSTFSTSTVIAWRLSNSYQRELSR
jgi:hypothetical protein